MKETILLIEDNQNILLINKRALELEGYYVLIAANIAAAEKILQQQKADLILLDIMLPDGSGLEYCRKLRTNSSVPILFLTAMGEKKHLMEGLCAGGDDYMTKPYDLEVMLMRIRTLLRRVALDRNENQLEYGPLRLDLVAVQGFLFGKDMLLTQKELALLLLLVRNEGKTLSKNTVYQAVWGQPLAEDSKALYMVVSRLKKKLAPAKKEGLDLVTKRNEGYYFYSS